MILAKSEIKENVPLGPLTTFKIGGPASYFTSVFSKQELVEAIKWAKSRDLPIFILGGGSNLLVSDKGFEGLVIKFCLSGFNFHDGNLYVNSGTPLARVVFETKNKGLSGLEWAVGIPGTIGGAINGNAGAYGESISEIVKSVNVLDVRSLKEKKFFKKQCGFKYRSSRFKKDAGLIILSAVLDLKPKNQKEIERKIKVCAGQRFSNPKQPSPGCFFKNIEWTRSDINKRRLISKFFELRQFKTKPKISAGFLIEQVGLKGKTVGDAMISPEHANFIVNLGRARAEDVIILASLIKEKVHTHYGFNLEEEVQLVGFD
jgi:UDP-N-acetylmuramate dehydrogenase